MNIVGIIQARMSSTRLPGKILKTIENKTVLEHVVERLRKAKNINTVVVATSEEKADDILYNWCINKNIDCYRGDINNVLSRFYKTSIKFSANVIVRVTSDNPLVDPDIVDETINLLLDSKADYAANNLVKTFPHGMDVEVIRFETLRSCVNEATKLSDLEHVTQYIRYRPSRFNLVNLKSSVDNHNIRITLDEMEDFLLITEVFKKLGENANYDQIKDFFNNNPELLEMNKNAKQAHEEYNKKLKII